MENIIANDIPELIIKAIETKNNIEIKFGTFISNVRKNCNIHNNIDDILEFTELLLEYYKLLSCDDKILQKNNFCFKNYVAKYIIFISGLKDLNYFVEYICPCKINDVSYRKLNGLLHVSLLETEFQYLKNLIETYPNIKILFDIFYDLFNKQYSYDFTNKCFENLKSVTENIEICLTINNFYISTSNLFNNLFNYYIINNKYANLNKYINFTCISKQIILDNNTISNDTINYVVKTFIYEINDDFINGLVNYNINLDYILDTELKQLYFDNGSFLHGQFKNYHNDKYYKSNYIKLIYKHCNDKTLSENIYIKICQKGYLLPFLISQEHTKNIIDILTNQIKMSFTMYIPLNDSIYFNFLDYSVLLFLTIAFNKYPELKTLTNIRYYFQIYAIYYCHFINASPNYICKIDNNYKHPSLYSNDFKHEFFVNELNMLFCATKLDYFKNNVCKIIEDTTFAYKFPTSEIIKGLLLNNHYPTQNNFDSVLNNELLLLHTDKITYRSMLSETLKMLIRHLVDIHKIIKNLLSYKILPTSNAMKTLVKIYSSRIIEDCVSERHGGTFDIEDKECNNLSYKDIIIQITKTLLEYNYPLNEDVILLLVMHNENIIIEKNIQINENIYYRLYKLCGIKIKKINNKLFNNPVHIMRHMCLSKCKLDKFINYIKEHNILPDRYCFKYASIFNNDITEWLLSLKCKPVLCSLKKKHDLKTLRYIDLIETEKYMQKQYKINI
ncbi:hypothetical protein Hokovirus_3_175 [Hokovirus HKV1]|uniref:Uncharacterized protein n=1 Tax=Hokovirus HKV1 TaxID=1977638 RepID=A0A1V0SGQ3_9VIRU|nr:hypothetical protein Hokovirus_3_175 [Hokovirus HKV1]